MCVCVRLCLCGTKGKVLHNLCPAVTQLWSNDWELQYDMSRRKLLQWNPDERKDKEKQRVSERGKQRSEYLTIPTESGHYGCDKTKQTTGTLNVTLMDVTPTKARRADKVKAFRHAQNHFCFYVPFTIYPHWLQSTLKAVLYFTHLWGCHCLNPHPH